MFVLLQAPVSSEEGSNVLQPLRALGNSTSRDPDRLVPLVAEVVADGRGMHSFLQRGCASHGHSPVAETFSLGLSGLSYLGLGLFMLSQRNKDMQHGSAHLKSFARLPPAAGDPVLIFCASRKSCHSCAALIADLLPHHLPETKVPPAVATRRTALIQELQEAQGGFVNSEMEGLMCAGVCYSALLQCLSQVQTAACMQTTVLSLCS